MLLALVDEGRELFSAAHGWARTVDRLAWASCPITQNGFVRICAQPHYANLVSAPEAVRRLARMIALTDHDFWTDDISILDETLIDRTKLVGHRQTTDAYLLALATRRNGALVTFDRAVPRDAVIGSQERHLVTPPATP